MNMFDYVLKLYSEKHGTIITKTNDDNIFLVSGFTKITLDTNDLRSNISIVCTDGKVLLSYCCEFGELARYDFIEGEWKYFSWTSTKKEIFNSLLYDGKYQELFEEMKQML